MSDRNYDVQPPLMNWPWDRYGYSFFSPYAGMLLTPRPNIGAILYHDPTAKYA